ncbi:Midasin [Wickerhamomyces ciferrii]|uniref:Midasin n=1 Tax=Wickerhamomyces ciferrii (strain ATCC 14091 / BCRC 22168 / CBS 111 / JCM 3599 / NBRC 0793 / NRRL Y-1031 F-60-10) TaxID=1206466 RepID=K0KLZ9_WICCF|nr:Midasin [Wickerhamomyces ciferrii]CCH42153.1 Midasin [Wickerhamomyces ciferrii]
MSDNFIIDETNPLRLKRTHHEESDDDQDDETQLLNQDIEGNKKRRFQKPNKVDVSQYNDDSSDEDYEKQEDVKPKEDTNAKDDSDSDMFASDDEEENENDKNDDDDKPKVKHSKIEFMDIKDFEKEAEIDQDEVNNNNHEEDESDEEETKPIDDYYYDQESSHSNNLPKHEPKIDAFNLRAEQSEGRFDIDGNFIRGESSEDEQDNQWLDGLKKKDIQKAKAAQLKRQELSKQKKEVNDEKLTEDLLFELIGELDPVETPLEALQRLNKGSKKQNRYKKFKLSEEEQETQRIKKEKVLKITSLAEKLIEHGVTDIYELEKESIMLRYKQESGKNYIKPQKEQKDIKESTSTDTATSTTSTTSPVQWEFRWVGDDKIHGPYGSNEMNYWKSNYFQNNVEIRKFGTSDFIHINKIDKF